jgi:hypothetical protein
MSAHTRGRKLPQKRFLKIDFHTGGNKNEQNYESDARR